LANKDVQCLAGLFRISAMLVFRYPIDETFQRHEFSSQDEISLTTSAFVDDSAVSVLCIVWRQYRTYDCSSDIYFPLNVAGSIHINVILWTDDVSYSSRALCSISHRLSLCMGLYALLPYWHN